MKNILLATYYLFISSLIFGQTIQFEYDSFNRLIKSTNGQTVIVYTYDELGNRLSKEITFAEDSVVYIPDANFKTALVGDPDVNSNFDTEIQYSEARAYADSIDVSNLSIANMTGIESFTSLIYLNCENNSIDSLDVSALLQLEALYCDNNLIEYINVNGLTKLRYLLCSNNRLRSIDVSTCSSLFMFYCSSNQVENIDVSNNASLSRFGCGYNGLSDVDVSANSNLYWFFCEGNNLTSLDLSSNTNLNWLRCNNNNLDSIDVSYSSIFSRLKCNDNELIYLNLQNGNNTNIDYTNTNYLYVLNNPDLTCVTVDDPDYSTTSWVSNFDDGVTFDIDCNFHYSLSSDSLALVNLYQTTNGLGWTDHTNWLTGPVNTWYGVKVEDQRVKKINLSSNNLVGFLSDSIGFLTALDTLILDHNILSGSIPEAIGELTELIDLELWENQFSGNIPVALGNLINLKNLDIGYNSLTGIIPTDLGSLTNLTDLWINSMDISGSIPSTIGNLTMLKTLGLPNLQLTGGIPVELCTLENLETLYLSDNMLSGNLPSEIGQLSKLRKLYLANNQLSGEIPSTIGQLDSLDYIWLTSNQFSGSIPSEIGNLTKLKNLYLWNNQLTGELPSELAFLSNLLVLSVGYNQLSGAVPPELTQLTSLTKIYFNYNNFTSIPDFSGLTNLSQLECQGNQLVFKSLEPNIVIPSFFYSPQTNVGTVQTFYAAPGQTIDIRIPGYDKAENDFFQWYFYDDEIAGETDSVLTFTEFSNEKSGIYHCAINNNLVTGLTLYSEPTSIDIVSLSPENNSINVDVDAGLSIVFPNNAYTVYGHYFTIYRSDHTVFYSLDVSKFHGSGTNTITPFNLSSLEENTQYYIKIDQGAFVDSEGNSFIGISDETIWTFSTTGTSENIELINTTIFNGEDECFGAQQTITVAGDGYPVIVQLNASATFIAGQSIRFLPGFHAQSGSYVSAYITTDGSFCDMLPQSLAQNVYEPEVLEKSVILENNEVSLISQGLKVYPNPTNGMVTIVMENFGDQKLLEIANISGQTVYKQIINDDKINIDISAFNKGLYIVTCSDRLTRKAQRVVLN